MSETEYQQAQEIGKRLRLLRKSAGLTHTELAELMNVSVATISTWERGKISGQIKQKSINKLIDLFKKKGISFSTQWLISGYGVPPVLKESTVLDEPTIDIYTKSSENDNPYYKGEIDTDFSLGLSLTEEIKIFTNIKNAVIHKIDHSYLEPFLLKGDIVGGIWKNKYRTTEKQLCIFFLDENIEIGFVCNTEVENFYNITLIKVSKDKIAITKEINNQHISKIAPIIRFWR